MSTTRNGFDQPTVGGDRDQWGTKLNNNAIALIDDAMDGWTTVSSTGGVVTLTATPAVTSQARERVLFFNGARTATVTAVIPNVEKWYFCAVGGSGSGVVIGVSGQNFVNCVAGQITTVLCNGTTTSNASQNTLDNISAPTQAYSFNGQQLTNLGAATTTGGAPNLAQVSALIAANITPAGGGTVRVTVADTTPGYLGSGKLALSGNIAGAVQNSGANETYSVTVTEPWIIQVSGEDQTLTTGSNLGHVYLPYGFTITETVQLNVGTNSTSGAVVGDIRTASGSIFSTLPSVASGQNISTASGTTQPVLSTSTFAAYTRLSFDCASAGTGARGLQFCFIGRRV